MPSLFVLQKCYQKLILTSVALNSVRIQIVFLYSTFSLLKMWQCNFLVTNKLYTCRTALRELGKYLQVEQRYMTLGHQQ